MSRYTIIGMKHTILIIDDDVGFRTNLKSVLKARGFDFIEAKNGEDGLGLMHSKKPDLIVLDLNMPGKNGFEVLVEKLADKRIASIPVIMASTSNDPQHIDKALALGVSDFVVKSGKDQSELLEKIKLQLGDADGRENFDEPTHMPHGGLSGYKVMWVEDDTYLTDIISRKLSGAGCTVIQAKNGEEALEFATKEMPDVIMLDILLPGMSGFEVLEKIKKDPSLKHIPVIVTSNLGQKGDIEKGEKLGAEKFLVKATVTLDEIIEETKKVLMRIKK